jgi:osmotically-inducible protein OsmY
MMRREILALALPLLAVGCMNRAAVSDTATSIGNRIRPAAREIANGSQRLVRAAGQAADDAALTAKVKGVLMTRKGLDPGGIRVRAEDGVIHLTGHARSKGEIQLVTQIARDTAGVARVDNRLKVMRAD